jgi:hypothetical protein
MTFQVSSSKTSTAPEVTATPEVKERKSNTVAIVGAICGIVGFAALVIGCFLLYRRRKKSLEVKEDGLPVGVYEVGGPQTPFMKTPTTLELVGEEIRYNPFVYRAELEADGSTHELGVDRVKAELSNS